MTSMKPVISDFSLKGLRGISFSAGGYRAAVLPGRGANVVMLENTTLGVNILRSPDSANSYNQKPSLYGIPVLFPPNRIDAGRFSACGRDYAFPVNETARSNHLHGFLADTPWHVEDQSIQPDNAKITLSFINNEASGFFNHYPHHFKITMTYTLSENGLLQEVSVLNKGDMPMPFGLGFHTTLNLPFHPEGSISSINLKMSVGGKWELDDRMLPTGKKLHPTDWEADLCNSGIAPLSHPLDNHYSGKPMKFNGELFNGAILTDSSAGLRIIYEAGKSYKHWMLYNGMENRKDFVCPEPQTWMVNAPNIDKQPDETGLIILEQGCLWKDYTNMRVEKI